MLQVVDQSRPAETVGVQVLKSRGLFPQKYWYWIGVGALLGHILVLNGLFALALSYLERKCLILYLICNMSVLPYIYIYIYRHALMIIKFLQHLEEDRHRQSSPRINWRMVLTRQTIRHHLLRVTLVWCFTP